MTDDYKNGLLNCPNCGAETVLRHKRHEFKFGADHEAIDVVVEKMPVWHCSRCRGAFTNWVAEEMRHDACCRAIGVLTPDEIRQELKKSGLTEMEFATMYETSVQKLREWLSRHRWPTISR